MVSATRTLFTEDDEVLKGKILAGQDAQTGGTCVGFDDAGVNAHAFVSAMFGEAS